MSTLAHAVLALFALSLTGPLLAAEKKTPNVVIIMADELGYGDVSTSGSTSIPTPNITRIAAGGVFCTSAYIPHMVGSAARAGLLTGRYPNRFGIERSVAWRPQDPTVGLPATEKTLAEALRPLGYKSGLIGKWHLGAHDNFHPLNRGFDEFYGFLGGGHRSFPEDLTLRHTHEARFEPDSYVTWIMRGMEPVRSQRYLTDDLTLEAIEFVRAQAKNPFFLFLSYSAPRPPLQAPEADVAAFSHIKEEKRRTYAAMITVMDRGIGQLLDFIDYLDIADDTIIFFLSSTGGDTLTSGAYNGEVKGKRGEPYEGGIRVPFIVRWPAKLPGGKTYSEPLSTLDIFATVAAATALPKDSAHPLDGIDLLPYLSEAKPEAPNRKLFLKHYDSGVHLVREGSFKLVQPKSDAAPLLFHLGRDPGEKTNIAAQNETLVRSLQESFKEWDAQMIAPTVPGIDPKEWGRGR
jgi:arylsulfatase A-like enzyme